MNKMIRSGAVLLIAVALSACSFYPKSQVRLPEDLPESYLQQTEETILANRVERWWESFDDVQLNEMMTVLFRQNLQIEQSYARLQQVRSLLSSARSGFFPVVNAEGQAGESMQPTALGEFTGENYQFSGAAAYELDLWGKIASRARSAGKGYEASLEDLKTLYLGLSAQLAELYYLAVEQRAQVALADETIHSFTSTLESVEARYRLGIVPAVDIYQARQSLTAARSSRHRFAAALATTEHALSVLIGKYPKQGMAGRLAELPTVQESFPAGLPSGLISCRPDLQAALRMIEAADADVAAAIADRFPSINLIGRYGYTSQEFSSGLIEGDFWNFLGNITLPLFDAGRRRAEVERNRAVARERVAAYQQAVLNAFREVEDALAENRETELRLASLIETEDATASTLRLSLDRYNFGITDYLPVLSAQRAHFEAQSRLLSVRRELVSARISLARSLGGEWMATEIDKRTAEKQEDKS
ncbi:MAG: hypothetical protein C0623_04090 [Desulfuromonas sp.]|nr:MAG: hypothetical protein C0623_04090 [Desulfuromonas sp.]